VQTASTDPIDPGSNSETTDEQYKGAILLHPN
jgi:hypothetical protein